MVDVVLRCTQDSAFRELRADGHANFGTHGNDIVCAAISVLARTAESFLTNNVDVEVFTEAVERGRFVLSVADVTPVNREQLRFLACFLREGFASLQVEFSDYVAFKQEIV